MGFSGWRRDGCPTSGAPYCLALPCRPAAPCVHAGRYMPEGGGAIASEIAGVIVRLRL